MRKISVILLLLFCLNLSACNSPGDRPAGSSEQLRPTETSATATEPVIAEPGCPYTQLMYAGRDVNPQHFQKTYAAGDLELIASIWETLTASTAKSVDNIEPWEAVMELSFGGLEENEYIKLYPNGHCVFGKTGEMYVLDEGSYEAISALLTDYTAENYGFTIDEDFLNVNTEVPEPITFSFDNSDFYVLPSITGDFTENWKLTPVETADGGTPGRFGYIQNIYTQDGFGPVEVSVYFDALQLGVFCDGMSARFTIDQATADLIAQQIEEFAGLN